MPIDLLLDGVDLPRPSYYKRREEEKKKKISNFGNENHLFRHKIQF